MITTQKLHDITEEELLVTDYLVLPSEEEDAVKIRLFFMESWLEIAEIEYDVPKYADFGDIDTIVYENMTFIEGDDNQRMALIQKSDILRTRVKRFLAYAMHDLLNRQDMLGSVPPGDDFTEDIVEKIYMGFEALTDSCEKAGIFNDMAEQIIAQWESMIPSLEPVDIIAAGYEFICPSCGDLNTIMEIPKSEIVQCEVCGRCYSVDGWADALE